MKILIITPEYPYPTDNGSKRRIAAGLEYFAQHHQISLVSLREETGLPEGQGGGKRTWQEWIYPIHTQKSITVLRSLLSHRSYRQTKFWHKAMALKIQEMLASESFDLVWVHYLSSVRFIEDWWRPGSEHPILLLDQHNVYTAFWDSFIFHSSNRLARLYSRLERSKAKRLQSIWFPRFDLIAAVSGQDLQDSLPFLMDGQDSLRVVPNGVDLEYFHGRRESKPADPARVVFVGSMDAQMNQEAVCWFADQVWGRIREAIPSCEFLIVGRNPSSRVQQLTQREGIIVTGSTLDVRPYFSTARVCVIPIQLGGGTKLKILEAMAMQLPIVSTTAGAQGLDLRDGVHFYLADDPETFASRVIDFIQDEKLARDMGLRARQLVGEKYSWQSIMLSLESQLQLMVGSQ